MLRGVNKIKAITNKSSKNNALIPYERTNPHICARVTDSRDIGVEGVSIKLGNTMCYK